MAIPGPLGLPAGSIVLPTSFLADAIYSATANTDIFSTPITIPRNGVLLIYVMPNASGVLSLNLNGNVMALNGGTR